LIDALNHACGFPCCIRYAPELEKRVRWYQGYRATSWRVDETYVMVAGNWKYLFRAVDKHGRLIDFMLSDRRNTRAAHRFLGKALTTMRHWPPSSLTTDQLGSYPRAISGYNGKASCQAPQSSEPANTSITLFEADHGALKRVIRPTRGFQTMKTASATIKGFEVMRMIRRGHCLTCKPHVKDEIRFVNKLFDIFTVAASLNDVTATLRQVSSCNRAAFCHTYRHRRF